MSIKDPGNKPSGLVFNIQKFSLHDGPGIRTTVFMKGCPMACKWCSNPESIKPGQEIMLYDIRCIGCKKCAEACDSGAISLTQRGREINWKLCDNCLKCAQACPSKAIECVGSYMTVDEVVKKVVDDRTFYDNSNGGMTVSGGEVFIQTKFIRELLKECRSKGIHTVLDTTGYALWKDIESVLEYVDLALIDIKHMDQKMHREGTGVGNEIILDNAEKIAENVRTWLRIPLIPGYNDSAANLKSVAGFASELGVEKVSILPYHELGASKYPKLGRTYPMNGTGIPDEKEMERAEKILKTYGLKVEIGR